MTPHAHDSPHAQTLSIGRFLHAFADRYLLEGDHPVTDQ